jgi:acyl-coenzyme A synthetase/AMP-(fatty) acid ligase
METLVAEDCTGMAGVPLTFEILRRQVDIASMSFPKLRYVTQAGGAMAAETTRWTRQAFAPARLFVMYGQTEATARLSYLPPDRATDKEGSIGVPIDGVELKVVDAAGDELPRGEIGELIARGDSITPGYLDEPEATAQILRAGWLWTGDLAYQDEEGYLFLTGRAKEIIKVGGHRVSPAEIERVIAAHPGVTEVAVVGRPDSLMGEVPVAFVVLGGTSKPSSGDLRAYSRAHLPPHMVPARFVSLAALPRNESGKVLRTELAEFQPPT